MLYTTPHSLAILAAALVATAEAVALTGDGTTQVNIFE